MASDSDDSDDDDDDHGRYEINLSECEMGRAGKSRERLEAELMEGQVVVPVADESVDAQAHRALDYDSIMAMSTTKAEDLHTTELVQLAEAPYAESEVMVAGSQAEEKFLENVIAATEAGDKLTALRKLPPSHRMLPEGVVGDA